jgi:hypothetical protein
MRIYLIILFLVTSTAAGAQKGNPFSNLQFDSVVVYDFNGGKGSDLSIIDSKGALARSVRKRALLERQEAITLADKLGRPSSYGGGTVACFDPHFGIVFYAKGRIIRHVTVCLDCNRLVADTVIPAQLQGKTGKGEDTYYMRNGLSATFRRHLNGLVKKYGFSHQTED